MKVGMIGLGKLGYPVALAMAMQGHEVVGYDKRQEAMTHWRSLPYETGPEGEPFDHWMLNGSGVRRSCNDPVGNHKGAQDRLTFGTLEDVARHASIIFVAVETPHAPEYEGVTPIPEQRADFDYTALKRAISDLAEMVKRPTVIAVISTVLPGTMRREIMPLLNADMRLVYNPSFIAMGTTMQDFLDPEFVLVGGDDHMARALVQTFYDATIYPGVCRPMSIESAELTKVAYNTFISMKLAVANVLMEVCDKVPGADIDEVSGALKAAHRRITGPQYMSGGMGDGGGCHPRDNIAMSWLAQRLDLHHDVFSDAMMAREDHARWLADMMVREATTGIGTGLRMFILGYAYKPNSSLVTGSHALLVAEILRREGAPVEMSDAHAEGGLTYPASPRVFLHGQNHDVHCYIQFPAGSVVIDPFRVIPDQPGVRVIRIGEGRLALEEETAKCA